MNLWDAIKDFWRTITNRFERIPEVSSIRLSGIVYSDYRRNAAGELVTDPGRGWVKGWVVAGTENRDIIIVARHAGPQTAEPMSHVFLTNNYGKRIDRKIVAVENVNLPNLNESSNFGDVAVCRLDQGLPVTINAYKFGKAERSKKVFTKTERGWSDALLSPSTHGWPLVQCYNRKEEELLVYGDSGLPWFVWDRGEWRVVSHTYRGLQGIGPWYMHPFALPAIHAAIQKLQNESKAATV